MHENSTQKVKKLGKIKKGKYFKNNTFFFKVLTSFVLDFKQHENPDQNEKYRKTMIYI